MKFHWLIGLGFVSSWLPAVEVGLFEGDWSLAKWSSPIALREAYWNPDTEETYTTVNSTDPNVPAGMILVDAWYSDPVSATIEDLSISAAGQVTGDEVGTVISLSRNRLLYRGEDVLTTVFANTTGDTLVESKREGDLQDLNIALKKPDSLAVADLAGTWSLINLISPDDITKVGNLSDVYFEGESSVAQGEITLNANGTYSGLFSGTVSVNGSSLIVQTAAGPITFRVNAGKTLGIATLERDDEAEMILLVRKPDSVSVSQLAGEWRFNRMSIPSTLTEVYFNTVTEQTRQADSDDFAGANEVLVDLFHKDQFELERGNLRVQPDGSVLGSAITSFAAGPNQSVIVTANGETLPFVINRDRTMMFAASGEGDSQQLIVVIKTSDEAAANGEEALDFTPVKVGGKFVLSWAGETRTKVEVATAGGVFEDLDGSLNQDAFEVDTTTVPKAIFRLVEEAALSPE